MAKANVKAFRGVSNLYIAPMNIDDNGKETYGTPQRLAGVQGITIDVNESQSTYYFDNKAALVVASEGEDVISLSISRTSLETRALIEGKEYDSKSKALFSVGKTNPYFALAFKATLTDGTSELYWFYKGKFTTGSREFNTVDDGTDVTNVSYTFTAIYSGEEYAYTSDGKLAPAKFAVIPDDNTLVANNWFTNVQTPDLIAGTYGPARKMFEFDFSLSGSMLCSFITAVDCSEFDLSSRTSLSGFFGGFNYGQDGFINAKSITGLDKILKSNIINTSSMFYYCKALKSLDLSKVDSSNVTNMKSMFEGCSSLTSLDLSGLDTGSVTDMSFMFDSCSSLTSLNMSEFNTKNVANMRSMFSGCSSLTSLDVSRFNTENVTDMQSMFNYCKNLTILDLSNFNTGKVTNMQRMFGTCFALTSLNLSNFDTSNVTNMEAMFYFLENLESLDLSSFVTDSVTNMTRMFQNGYTGQRKVSKLSKLTLGNNWASNASITLVDLLDLPLTHDSCLDVFNKLADKKALGQSTATLKIYPKTYALMSSEEFDIATNKGWTVVKA